MVEELYGWTGAFDYDILKEHADVFKFDRSYNGSHFDIAGVAYYGYIDNNKIVILNGIKKVISYSYELPEGEVFNGGYYEVMKTNKGYYYNGVINADECNKYADVECQYGVKPYDELNEEYDSIYFFNGKYIIFKDDLNHVYMIGE